MMEQIEALANPVESQEEQDREQALMELAYEKARQGMPKQGRNQTTPKLATDLMANAHRKCMDPPQIRASHRVREFHIPVNRNATFEPAPRPTPANPDKQNK